MSKNKFSKNSISNKKQKCYEYFQNFLEKKNFKYNDIYPNNSHKYKGPLYKNNSCYIDSLLISLFMNYNEYLTKIFIQPNKTDKPFVKYFKLFMALFINIIRNNIILKHDIDISFLRYISNKYKTQHKITIHNLSQNDPTYLLFSLYDTIGSEYISYGVNPISNDKISDVVPIDEKHSLFHVYINRLMYDNNNKLFFNDRSLTIEQKISNVELKSIIIHSGGTNSGHYTSYVKIYNDWYFFDDMNPILNKINIDEKKHKNKISKYSTLLLYY